MKRVVAPSDYAAPSIAEHVGLYADATIYVLGFGTSLQHFDWTRLDNRVTIAINDAVTKYVPTYHIVADYSARTRYWKHDYQDTTTIVVGEDTAREAAEIKWKHLNKVRSFSRVRDNLWNIPRNNDQLYVQRTTATAATMLAWKLGASRVYLLGVDGYRLTSGVHYANGTEHKKHHPRDTDRTEGDRVISEVHQEWLQDFANLRQFFNQRPSHGSDVPQIYVANPLSIVTTWPRVTIEEALQ